MSVIETEFQVFLQKIIGDLKVDPKFLYLIESLLNENEIPPEVRIGQVKTMIKIAKSNFQCNKTQSPPALVLHKGGLHASNL
ncbi:hypothetical protein [Paenibacillus sp. FSL L8-0709]|uniref:hypothetical protein n=1 Tax=Paenibacillus sp. FSL L8-0709 TaxID=2975312 RepID=UPI0030F9009C